MLITKSDIAAKSIVIGAAKAGARDTTYDATVGCIILDGAGIRSGRYVLPPRGIVWVISQETFNMPGNVTGLATLRTTWTHQGVLALNVGVIDPGWSGPLATVLVNFGKSDFSVEVGSQFLRVMFFSHEAVAAVNSIQIGSEYKKIIMLRSKNFSESFLNMKSLISDVKNDIFKLPTIAYWFAFFALVAALFSLLLPIGYTVLTDRIKETTKIESLQRQIDELRAIRGVKSERE